MAEAEANVGVLGWLGFIIINFAAWGIVATSSYISWILGFILTAAYTAGLLGLALWLERKDVSKFRQFLNLLWVLIASFVFVLGAFIAIQVIGKIGREDTAGTSEGSLGHSSISTPLDTLAALLPSNASAELQTWATGRSTATNYAVYGAGVYFTAVSDMYRAGGILLRASGGSTSEVVPWSAGSKYFVESSSALYFLAYSNSTSRDGIWQIASGTPNSATEVVSRSDLSPPSNINELFFDTDSSTLYFKGGYVCSSSGSWVETIFRSDRTPAGTTDLRGDECGKSPGDDGNSTGGGGGGGGTRNDGPRDQELWAVLFVALAPMMAVAAYALISKQLPGPFVNIYGGIEAVVIILYMLAVGLDDNMDSFGQFLKWFLTIYNSLFWALLVVWSATSSDLPPWKEELKSWAVVFVGVSFFVMIHIDLEIPWSQDAWRWVVYFFLTLLQLLLSAIVSRTVPMVAGATGLFVLAWKIAYEIVAFAGLEQGEFQMLSVLAIVAFQGAGIVLGAIWYSSQREHVDALILALLKCETAKVKEMRKQDWTMTGPAGP